MTVAVPRADRRAFSEVSELQPVGPGSFDADVHPAWTIGGKPNGGQPPRHTGTGGNVEQRSPAAYWRPSSTPTGPVPLAAAHCGPVTGCCSYGLNG